jgi:hypothetical protein
MYPALVSIVTALIIWLLDREENYKPDTIHPQTLSYEVVFSTSPQVGIKLSTLVMIGILYRYM